MSAEPVQAAAWTPARIGSRLRPLLTPYWALLLLFALVALLAPLIAPYDPIQADLEAKLLPPSSAHLFGTDENGMDIFSRVLFATRTDLVVAVLGVAIAFVVGVPIGALCGYLGGWLDELFNRTSEIVQSIPLFLFALMIFAALGNSKTILVAVVAIVNIPIFLKLTRSVVQPIKNQDYIAAARLAGQPTSRIVLRHVLPNTLGPIVSQASISAAYAIQITAGLAFIGLGVELPHPEWGSMIQQGAPLIMDGDWWVSVFPGLAVLLAVVAFGGVGRQIARRYDR
ncbi:MAG: ABC transporter permease [Solirubrobacteraceae bacterium]|nr:ABC transporter permease [Solirubrobacteraceae bacterium]